MALSGPGKTVATTVGTVVLMGGLAWASVPFYSWFCKVTGFGGVPNVTEAGADHVLDQTIKIRFDASIDPDMDWTFKPVERTMEIKIGETGLAFYEAHNPTDRPIAGSAVYNVFPYEAGGYFTKIECFCFTEQVLQPGETVQMPVTFYVDPEMVDDIDAKHVNSITLSYTFYETDLPEGYAALDQAQETNLN
ncbi:cytochrome c oxidase assembly protein [Sulfitobacter sp. BDSS02]|uniref:cytochrome c oxidase assembly protein n=1 Tax=Heliomarina baculiformis TaxID=2872036 RepID=UPI001EE219E7|nr:cytochrome c oxidase assembly protein [Heliomarina baculiformis]MBL3701897.1 cytochrome c oxidase assembly protein [Sulfitobacter sp. BDSS02]MBR9848247.1 cytochrome c oxidase assembly protein [Paracoccaceae bacterium]